MGGKPQKSSIKWVTEQAPFEKKKQMESSDYEENGSLLANGEEITGPGDDLLRRMSSISKEPVHVQACF